MKKGTYTFILLTMLLIFSSCSEEDGEVKIPRGVLKKEQFAKVLADLSLAESAANLNIKNVKIEKTDSVYAFDPFKENHITEGQFDTSALFYSKHPDLYTEAYEEAMRMLTEMQAKREQLKQAEVKKDSVKK
jgi:hypothetical protein